MAKKKKRGRPRINEAEPLRELITMRITERDKRLILRARRLDKTKELPTKMRQALMDAVRESLS